MDEVNDFLKQQNENTKRAESNGTDKSNQSDGNDVASTESKNPKNADVYFLVLAAQNVESQIQLMTLFPGWNWHIVKIFSYISAMHCT